MNYQIMTVDQDGKKTFYGAKFRKDNLSQYHIKSVLKAMSIMVLKISLSNFCNWLFDNETDNTVGLQFKNHHEMSLSLCALILEKHLVSSDYF